MTLTWPARFVQVEFKMIAEKTHRPQKSWELASPHNCYCRCRNPGGFIWSLLKPWWGLESEHYSRPMVEWAHGYFQRRDEEHPFTSVLGLCQMVVITCRSPAMTLVDFIRRTCATCMWFARGRIRHALCDFYLLYDTLRTLCTKTTSPFIAMTFLRQSQPPFAA